MENDIVSPELGGYLSILLGHAAKHGDSEYVGVLSEDGNIVAVTDGWASAETAKRCADELNDCLGIVKEKPQFVFVAIRAKRALDFVLEHYDALDRYQVADTEVFTTCGMPESVGRAIEWLYCDKGRNRDE